ncbi:transposase family protein [Streptomyces halstedii]|uniref:transposase family protein n=1 Tax=Streptomyces halstedii TaxID=1944 RepID=UPI00382DB758
MDVLTSWAPALHEALTGLGEGDHVIVDGTLIPIDRIRADEPYHSRKHRQQGMNVLVIARPDDTPPWLSRATPGRTHDLTAPAPTASSKPASPGRSSSLADRAHQGAGSTVRTPYHRHRGQPEHYQEFNRDHARLRPPGERALAQLKSRRLLRRARCSTCLFGTILQAVTPY